MAATYHRPTRYVRNGHTDESKGFLRCGKITARRACGHYLPFFRDAAGRVCIDQDFSFCTGDCGGNYPDRFLLERVGVKCDGLHRKIESRAVSYGYGGDNHARADYDAVMDEITGRATRRSEVL